MRNTPASQWVVVLFATIIFLGTVFSPPSLMDDVDAVHAQAARTMLESGDWVTAHLDGVKYLDKAPMTLWMIASSYAVFGVRDWAARLPFVLTVILLCWVTMRFGAWAFSPQAGFHAGLVLTTCVGLFLFTRVLIPDAGLTLTVTVSMWALLRCLDEAEPPSRLWPLLLGASMGVGLLLKGLLAVMLPSGAAFVYLLVTRQFFHRATWKRLRPFFGVSVMTLIAAPWYVLATLRNPPYLDFTLNSEPGVYRGFFWRYFINEHLLRYFNLRYPRDYNTVPRPWFWLSHLIWFFPWTGFFPAMARLNFRPVDRAGRARLLALCWAGFLLVFFTFSTTQEYYSLPAYPAFALLLGSAIASGRRWTKWALKSSAAVASVALVAILAILWHVRGMDTPGDIATALKRNPDAYTLSLGHMSDLSLASFAYLRVPLAMAAIAFALGATVWFIRSRPLACLLLAVMMAVLIHAARAAMVTFDPYLSSKPLAEALRKDPAARLVVGDQYYTFSSVFFYTNRHALLWDGRVNNLEYGSYAPGAPNAFIGDEKLKQIWQSPDTVALVVDAPRLERARKLLGGSALHLVKESGGKALFLNRPALSE